MNKLTDLREKCIEHQDFHKGDDGVFRGWISIEDLDEIIYELCNPIKVREIEQRLLEG